MLRSHMWFVVVVLMFPALLLLSTCGKESPTKPSEPEQPPTPPTPVATKIEITPAEATLNAIGRTVRLTARVLDQNNRPMAGATVSWTSNAVGIATVSDQGLVTAVANGTAVITARSGNASAAANVTVAQTAGSVAIEPDMVSLMSIGETVQLTATVRDGNEQPVAGAAVTWQSSDESVATVGAQGLVTAVANGTAVITARSGNASAAANVTVAQTASSVAIEPDMVSLMSIGETVQLTATVRDGNGQPVAGAAVTWQSSDESVATVGAQGLVTAVANGSAVITARSGNASAAANVTVAQTAGSVAIEPAMVSLMSIGETVQLTATVRDGNGQPVADAAVTWQSSDDSVATVGAQGLVTAVANGSAVITARSGNASAAANVTVAQTAGSVAIEPDMVSLMSIGETVQLTATVRDGNGQPVADAAVTWQSSDESVATVDAQGLVTAVANGSAIITARSGNASGAANVTVAQTAGSIAIEPAMVSLMSIGETVQLTATVRDGNGQPVADAAVTWQSSDESVATVDAQGLVTAVKYGTAVITARSGSASATVNVAVAQTAGSIAIEPREATIAYIGESVQLTVTVLDQTGQPVADAMVSWESSDESVATVDARGLVTSVMSGAARITARLGDLEDSIWVIVEDFIPRTERDVLVALYHSLGGPEWNNNTNWLSERPIGDWNGVATNAFGTVIGLSLPDNGLKGTLPVQLSLLTGLTALTLQDNQLTGEIPVELGLLPGLNRLDLGNNNLTGGIPAELGDLGRLFHLDLSRNNLTGGIPVELGQLSTLTNHLSVFGAGPVLNLGDNLLSGPIPPELGNLIKVGYLSLRDNRLTGGIPAELGQLSEASVLDLSGNQLAGGIPSEFGTLADVMTLRLHNNPALSGPLPLSMIALERLESLYLHQTQLCVPAVLEEWVNSINVAIYNYCVTESSDRDVLIAFYHAAGGGNWSNSDNWLSSRPLHQWFGISIDADGRVEQINLEGNNLSGTVTPALARLAALKSLDLGGNPSLAGPLPLELADLPLERVRVAGTEVCAPSDEAFQAWLMALPEGSGVAHCDRLREIDRDVLIELYHATDGPNWNYSKNWLTDLPVENWIGVSTDRTGPGDHPEPQLGRAEGNDSRGTRPADQTRDTGPGEQ